MSTTEQYPDCTGLTFETVWASLTRTSEIVAGMKKDNAEGEARLEKMIQENRQFWEDSTRRMEALQASVSEQQKKTDAQLAETDKQIKETGEQMKETDRRLAETDKYIKETDRLIRNTTKQLGDLGNRMGQLVEQLVTAGAIPRFNAMGYHFTKASTRVKILDPKTEKTRTEADVVLENGEAVIVVEVKTEPSLSDIAQHIRRLQIFREDRVMSSPNDGKKLFGAIAAAVFPDEVQEAAVSADFYVIVQSGDTVKIAVPKDFVPTAF